MRVAKTKALISFAVTAKLICAFVFAYADCWFSHGAAQMFTPISGKTLQNDSSPEPDGRFSRNLVCSIVDSGQPIIVCSNDGPRMTLTNLMVRSDLET